MVNTKTKPIPIKAANSSSSTKYSSTSPPLSTSSSGASPQTSSSSNESPATTIQTLIVRPSNANSAIANGVGCVPKKHAATVAERDAAMPGTAAFAQQLLSQNSCRLTKSETASKLDGGSSSQNATVGGNNGSQHHHHISSDILDDLASRFIINVPDDERNNLIRICFQIELAHWFYLDFFFAGDEKKCGMKQFAMSLFQHIPFLREHLSTIDKILENWKQYKLTVPTYGAILLSEDLTHVLLVQSYWAKSSWGFPKGKVNENEDPIHCATREVFEETGYDITHLIVQSDYIESIINDQYTRLYLVRNIPLKTLFMPRTRKEIKCCEWFSIDTLPINKNDANTKQSLGINANSFFMIMPFIKRLKKWVSDKRSSLGDLSMSQQNINKLKFNGQHSSNIHNFNNAALTNNKKTDTKMPFKTVSISSASTPPNQSQSFAATTPNSSKLSSSKRQRHKSMGDLDGMTKSTQMINGFQNNLRMLNGTGPNPSQTSTNVFNDLTSSNMLSGNQSDYPDQRDKHQKQNVRRQKSAYSGNSLKVVETTPATAASPNKQKTPSSSGVGSSIRMAAYNYDCVKESNVDATKQHTKQSTRPTKLNNSADIVSYSYSNGATGKSTGKSENLDSSFETKRNGPTNKKMTPVSVPKLSNRSQKADRTKSDIQEKIDAPINDKHMPVNGLTLNGLSLKVTSNATDIPKQCNVNVALSPHFDAWQDFSFSKKYIANVFFQ